MPFTDVLSSEYSATEDLRSSQVLTNGSGRFDYNPSTADVGSVLGRRLSHRSDLWGSSGELSSTVFENTGSNAGLWRPARSKVWRTNSHNVISYLIYSLSMLIYNPTVHRFNFSRMMFMVANLVPAYPLR